MNDLYSRFILNCPVEEGEVRMMFNVEQAQWFYLDFIRAKDPSLPNLNLRDFTHQLFTLVEPLQKYLPRSQELYSEFVEYRKLVPVYGGILLNAAMDKCVIVKGWSRSFSFPKGKINQNENELDCCIREVDEETGYTISPNQVNESDFLYATINQQQIKLFIATNVPETFEFKSRTRKEIREILWVEVQNLPANIEHAFRPNQYVMVIPFVSPLKKWIKARKAQMLKDGTATPTTTTTAAAVPTPTPTPIPTTPIPVPVVPTVWSKFSFDQSITDPFRRMVLPAT
eukprot:c2586_g1_i1.p1 GENE.c2586_g1_i1~~c2586_g1_i1.p1  ORF type:complete len:306 (+),score=76.36 c2586_g1_i1:66-920(+)